MIGDGTFTYAPKPFVQMYTISAYVKGYYVQVAYFLLIDKSRATYDKMWKVLGQLAKDLAGIDLNSQVLITDFEDAAFKSAGDTYPGLTLWACRFHLGQSWWRYIQKEAVLREAYLAPKTPIGKNRTYDKGKGKTQRRT